jgi:hypothetical protein
LAEAYQPIRRYETARVSELLQSQLLQPAASAVLEPRLGEARIPFPQVVGPMTPSFHEFNSLFARDGHLLSLGGVVGEQDTTGDEALYAYRRGSRTVQFGQFYYDTAGHRPNADLRQKSLSAFYQDDINAKNSWQLEGRTSRVESGDVRLQFDPAAFFPTERREIDADAVRIGLRHSASPDSTWLFSFIASERDEDIAQSITFPGLSVELKQEFRTRTKVGEFQYLGRWRALDAIAGAGYVRNHDSDRAIETVTFDPLPPFPPTETFGESDADHANAYVYALWRGPGGSTVTTALAVDDYEDDVRFSQRRTSPKLGVVVPLSGGTTLRAAAFRSVKRLLTTNQTLEPTQVAGFNQLFDDVNETRSERIGAAVDQRFSRTVFAGVELTSRELEVPILGPGNMLVRWEEWNERLHRAYASWLVTPRFGAGIEYVYDYQRRELPPGVGDIFPTRMTTHYTPATVTYHHPRGPFVVLRATHVSQDVHVVDPVGTETSGEDHFWIADLSLGMRLPRRWGSVSLDVLNLFDEQFRYQDTDLLGTPRIPLFQPERLVLLRARINLF